MLTLRRFAILLLAFTPTVTDAGENPAVGLIPKAQAQIKMDGHLEDWVGAFVTPVHVGHPNFANRGGMFYFLWDEKNLYIGLKCLDRKPAHVAPDTQIYNGDAVEFYLDTRRGEQLGAAKFGPGTLHMFWTPSTKTTIKPRMQVRNLPVFKIFKLKEAGVAAEKTPWGYTAEFKLPWANFPNFTPKTGEIVGIDCELCSSDGGLRVDRTFVYSSPRSVATPSAFGQVRLVEKIDSSQLRSFGRVLLPLSMNRSTNYAWLYGRVCISPTIAGEIAKLEGRVLDSKGQVRKKTNGSIGMVTKGAGFLMWSGSWELFDLPAGTFMLEVQALDKFGRIIASRREQFLRGNVGIRGK